MDNILFIYGYPQLMKFEKCWCLQDLAGLFWIRFWVSFGLFQCSLHLHDCASFFLVFFTSPIRVPSTWNPAVHAQTLDAAGPQVCGCLVVWPAFGIISHANSSESPGCDLTWINVASFQNLVKGQKWKPQTMLGSHKLPLIPATLRNNKTVHF